MATSECCGHGSTTRDSSGSSISGCRWMERVGAARERYVPEGSWAATALKSVRVAELGLETSGRVGCLGVVLRLMRSALGTRLRGLLAKTDLTDGAGEGVYRAAG